MKRSRGFSTLFTEWLCSLFDTLKTRLNHPTQGQEHESIEDWLKQQILRNGDFRDVPDFPACIDALSTFAELLTWLGIADFSSSQEGELAAFTVLMDLATRLISTESDVRETLAWIQTYPFTDPFFRKSVEEEAQRGLTTLEEALPAPFDTPHFPLLMAQAALFLLIERIDTQEPDYRASFARWMIVKLTEQPYAWSAI